MKKSTVNLISALCMILAVVFFIGLVIDLLQGDSLDTPTISVIETTSDTQNPSTVFISEVDGAEKYEIYVDNEYVGDTLTTEFTLSRYMGAGVYTVVVRAVGTDSDGNEIKSSFSNAVEVCVAYG